MLVHTAVQVRQGLPKCPDLPPILSQPVVLGPHEVDVGQPTLWTGETRTEKRGHRLYGQRSGTIVCEAHAGLEDTPSLEHAVDDLCPETCARVLEIDLQLAPWILVALCVPCIAESTADD
jgi:hypothetical protein